MKKSPSSMSSASENNENFKLSYRIILFILIASYIFKIKKYIKKQTSDRKMSANKVRSQNIT